MEQTAITIPESTQLKAEALSALARANAVKIIDNATLL